MMISTKQFRLQCLAFLLSVFLVACGGSETKPEEMVEEPLSDMPTDQTVVAVETETEKHERLRQAKLEKFGPNPYLSNRALVSRQAKLDFAAASEVLRSGDLVAAETLFLTIVETYPELSGASYNLAVMKSGQGDDEAALVHLETALTRNNNNLDAHLLKAYIHRTSGDFAAAEQEYLDSIEIWGAFVPALKNLGILYDLYMGKLAEAYFYYEQYLALIDEPDKQVLGWSVDLERQMAKKGIEKIVVEEPLMPCVPASAGDAQVSEEAQTDAAPQSGAIPEAAMQPCISEDGTVFDPSKTETATTENIETTEQSAEVAEPESLQAPVEKKE